MEPIIPSTHSPPSACDPCQRSRSIWHSGPLGIERRTIKSWPSTRRCSSQSSNRCISYFHPSDVHRTFVCITSRGSYPSFRQIWSAVSTKSGTYGPKPDAAWPSRQHDLATAAHWGRISSGRTRTYNDKHAATALIGRRIRSTVVAIISSAITQIALDSVRLYGRSVAYIQAQLCVYPPRTPSGCGYSFCSPGWPELWPARQCRRICGRAPPPQIHCLDARDFNR